MYSVILHVFEIKGFMIYFVFACLSPCNRTVEVVRYMNVKLNVNVLHERRFGDNVCTTCKHNRYGQLLFEIFLSVMNNEAQERNIFLLCSML